MGTGSSLRRHMDDDDILGEEYDGVGGVMKHIPIEIKTRGRLGLRSVGSLGRPKPKGGSLRSALSVELENPEVERIRKDFEMYRMNKDNEIANLQKREQKFETENKRLRTELQALQKTCAKLRSELDSAVRQGSQALERASTFETERNKVQKQFKIFREAKESEIQNLLKARRDLENKLNRLSHGLIVDDLETSSRMSNGMDAIGASMGGDWWTPMDSEPSLGSTTQLQVPQGKGPEFAHSIVELEGPFTNVTKDDWNNAAASLAQVNPIVPDIPVNNNIRLYISAPQDVYRELDILKKDYLPGLAKLVSNEGRTLVVIHIPDDVLDCVSADKCLSAVERQVMDSIVFLAFLGETTNRYTKHEYEKAYLANPSSRATIFCFQDQDLNRYGNESSKELRELIQTKGSGAVILDPYTTPEQGVQAAAQELEKIIKIELGIDQEKGESDSGFLDTESSDVLCGGGLWDINGDYEQIEAFQYAAKSCCQMGFEKYYERLNFHVSAAGPLPPLLISGGSGSGRSLLLAKWLELQQERAASCGTLVLYHFVGHPTSTSADPVHMIRRLTAQLTKYMSSPPTLSCDPSRLVDEFARWLEKISSKTPGGVILVLDSIDRFQQAEVHLKWLLDPLPVDSRVIVSVHEDTCPQSWRSWPTVHLEPLSNKNVKELVRSECTRQQTELTSEQESRILTHCRTGATCNPQYVMLMVSDIACSQHEESVDGSLDRILTTSSCIELYISVINVLQNQYGTGQGKGLIKKLLRYLYGCRNGLGEWEMMDLIPELTWTVWAPLYNDLQDRHIVTVRAGIVMLAHEQVFEAVRNLFFSGSDEKCLDGVRESLIQYLSQSLGPGEVTCRVADEVPWLLRQIGDKTALRECLSTNLCIFQKLHGRGRSAELLSLWQYIGVDKATMAQTYFLTTKKMEELVSSHEGLITLPRVADLYEAVGRFLRDLGLLEQALTPLQRALELRESSLDPDHPVVAQALHHLAGLHAQWGKYPTAETLYKQALEIKENAFGGDHNSVAVELDALAVLYQKQDKHELAEPLYKRAVAIKRKSKASRLASSVLKANESPHRRPPQLEDLALGSDSPDLARTLNEMGVFYYLQNNQEQAELFFKKSLAMRENVLGPNHPDIAQSLFNLAGLYTDKKQFSLAEPLYERALQIRKQHFPLENEKVASVIKNLAQIYKLQNKLEEAEPFYKQSIEIRERSFGRNHPAVATALVNLAVLLSQQNKHDSALPLYERALAIYEKTLGPAHPRVAETLRNLAKLRYDQGDFEMAAKLYKRATEIKDSDMYNGKLVSRQSSSDDIASSAKNELGA